MKRFVIEIIGFLFLMFCIALGLDIVVSRGLLEMDDYRFMSWADISKSKASSDLLVMGNSRALSHFEPWTITDSCGVSAYNLGVGGYPINVEILKYRYYRLHNDKPKYIVQQVDYYTICEGSLPKNHQSEQYMPLVYDRGIRPELRHSGYTWMDLNVPMYRYFGYQQVIKNGLLEFFNVKHYVSDPSRLGHHYEEGQIDIERNESLEPQNAEMDPAAQALFESYLAECQEEGIFVILVNSPTYCARTAITEGLDGVNEYFYEVAAKYGAVYLNYQDCYLCNDPSNFAAAVHLNTSGAHLFSSLFAGDLKGILNK